MSVAEPRRIVLFRHAKADWPPVSDHERPLAERGRMDAAVAGRKLADTGDFQSGYLHLREGEAQLH